MMELDRILEQLQPCKSTTRLIGAVGHSVFVRTDVEPNEWVVVYHRQNTPPYEGLVFQSREDVVAYFHAANMRDGWEVVVRAEVG